MTFTLVTVTDKKEFNRFVSAHDSGSFLQSWEWGDFISRSGKTPKRVFVKDRSNQTVLAAQLFTYPLPKTKSHYVYIPYGPLMASQVNAREVLDFFIKAIKTEYPHAVFLRFESKDQLSLIGKVTQHIQPGKTLVLDLTKNTETLLKEMHTKTRYNIKVAERHGVATTQTDDTHAVGLKLIDETAKRQNYKSHPLRYYQDLMKYFHSLKESDVQVQLYESSKDGVVLAAGLMIDFGSTRTYLFGGTSDEQRNTMAPYALHWNAIQHAHSAGLTRYDFWGIETASGQTPGFVRFKLGWGGTQFTYPPTQDIIWKPLWYTTYTLIRSLHRKISR